MKPGPGFHSLQVIVAAGTERVFRRAEWLDAIVVVQRGEIELCSPTGMCRTFGRGALLVLDGVQLRCLRNNGPEPAVLVSVARADRFLSGRDAVSPRAVSNDARTE